MFTYSLETDEQKNQLYIGKVIREPFGVFYLDENFERQPLNIEGLKPTDPILRKQDKIVLSSSQFPWIKEVKLETTVGRLLLNLISVY